VAILNQKRVENAPIPYLLVKNIQIAEIKILVKANDW
jgi:hypothetical protein